MDAACIRFGFLPRQMIRAISEHSEVHFSTCCWFLKLQIQTLVVHSSRLMILQCKVSELTAEDVFHLSWALNLPLLVLWHSWHKIV